jgi:hypothetical protein
LLTLDDEDPTRDDAQLDRPAFRRLVLLVEGLENWSRWAGPSADRSVLRSAGRQIAARFDRRYLGVRLLVAAVALDKTAPIDDLTDIADLLAGPPVATTGVATVAQALRKQFGWQHPTDPSPVFEAAQRLAARGDLVGGMLAVALAGHGKTLGWPARWRELVRSLRRHDEADVRLAALDLSLAPQ